MNSLGALLSFLRPQYVFLLAALILGVLYNVFTPPLQANDEDNHFKRVFQITEGYFLPYKENQRLGGRLPAEYKHFAFPYVQAATNLKCPIDTARVRESQQAWLDHSDRIFFDFPNTSYYCPVSYLPQAAAVYAASQKDISIASVYYTGRIAIYLVWALCLFLVIGALPSWQWLFTFLSLLPMQVYISNSYSADTVTNILSLAFLGAVLKYTFDDKIFSWRRLLFLLIIGTLLALSKIVYVGLVLSFLIIPLSKFKSRIQQAGFAVLLFFSCFTAAYLWSETVLCYYTPYTAYNPDVRDFSCVSNCANYEAQKALIFKDASYFPTVVYNSIFRHPHTYLKSYVANLGQTDMVLPDWLYILAYAALLFIAVAEKNTYALRLWQKLILVFASFVSFVLLLLSQHLTWDCVGDDIVDLIQGRYLVPLFPAFFLLITHSRIKMRLGAGLACVTALGLLHYGALRIIHNRFHKDDSVARWEFECDAEQILQNTWFRTSNPAVFLGEAKVKYDSVAHSGISSARLKGFTPFAFTYNFRGLGTGDLVEVSLWQKGGNAQIVFTGKGDTCPDYYQPVKEYVYKRADGWKKTDFAFTITRPCLSPGYRYQMFVWNTDSNRVMYVDDLKFRLRKFLPYSPTEPDYW